MEFVRHRVFSFAQESTRYCNYSKDKFGKELTFIAPLWLELPNGHYHLEKHRSKIDDASCYYTEDNTEGKRNYHHIKTFNDYIYSLEVAEQSYLNLLNQGWIPQQARSVLPNCLKTELVMTGTVNQWKEFFVLRDTKSAHPQAYELAHSLHIEFIKKGYIHE